MYNTIIFLSVLPTSSGLRAQHNVSDDLRHANDTSLVQSWLPSCFCFGKKDKPLPEDTPEVIEEVFEPMQIRVRVTNGEREDVELNVGKSTTVQIIKEVFKAEYTRVQGRKFFTGNPVELSYGNNVLSDSTTLRELDVEDDALLFCEFSAVEEKMWQRELERQQKKQIAKEIKNGTFNGFGKYTYPGGNRYEGDFHNGQRHGHGCEFSSYGHKFYEGEWRNDKMHGSGIITFESGGKYDGQFWLGTYHGQGTMIYRDGARYEGEWKDGAKHGQGTILLSIGQYEGQFDKGRYHGQGIMTYSDGGKYEGQWERGKYHGHGTLTYHNGATYEGEWENGACDGMGTSTFPDGETYSGQWMKDKYDGLVKYRFSDGSQWSGYCKGLHRHGPALRTDASGDEYQEQWQNGRRVAFTHVLRGHFYHFT